MNATPPVWFTYDNQLIWAPRWKNNSCAVDSVLFALKQTRPIAHRECQKAYDQRDKKLKLSIELLKSDWFKLSEAGVTAKVQPINDIVQGDLKKVNKAGSDDAQFTSVNAYMAVVLDTLPEFGLILVRRRLCTICQSEPTTKNVKLSILDPSPRVDQCITGRIPRHLQDLSSFLDAYFCSYLDDDAQCKTCRKDLHTTHHIDQILPERMVVVGHWLKEYLEEPNVSFGYSTSLTVAYKATYRIMGFIACENKHFRTYLLIYKTASTEVLSVVQYDGMASNGELKKQSRNRFANFPIKGEVTFILGRISSEMSHVE